MLKFIEGNRDNYTFITLRKDIIDITLIDNDILYLTQNELYLFTLPQIDKLIYQKLNIIQLLDKYQSSYKLTYLFKTTSNYLILLIYQTQNKICELINLDCQYTFTNLKILNFLDTKVFNGLAIQNGILYQIIKGQINIIIKQYENELFKEIISIIRIKNNLLITTQLQTFILNDKFEIEELEIPTLCEIHNAIILNDIYYIIKDNLIYKIDNQNLIILKHEYKILGLQNKDNKVFIYYYNNQNFFCFQELLGNYQLIIKLPFIVQEAYLLENETFIIIDNEKNINLIFEPDYQTILSKKYQIENLTEDIDLKNKNQLPQKQTQEQLFYINKTQRTYYKLDEMINISLKYSYLQLLLLICARIRIFQQFFILVQKMGQNKNLSQLKELLTIQKLKKCECLENEIILDEFIEECLNHKQDIFFIYFQKFLLENPDYISYEKYELILEQPFNRKLYEQAKLEVPTLPKSALKRQANFIKFLMKSKQVFIQDLYIKKIQQLERIQSGIIGNCIQCFECKKQILSEIKIVKYSECGHAYHKTCWRMQHDCKSQIVMSQFKRV